MRRRDTPSLPGTVLGGLHDVTHRVFYERNSMRVAFTFFALLVTSPAFADQCPHCSHTLLAPNTVTRWYYVPAPLSLSGARELDPVRCPCETFVGFCPCGGARKEIPQVVLPVYRVSQGRPVLGLFRGRCR